MPLFPVGTFIYLFSLFALYCALLAFYVYVPVCILAIFFVSQINWIGIGFLNLRVELGLLGNR